MNNSSSVKTRFDAVERRYGKTIKGNTPRKPKAKLTVKPVLGKGRIGIKGKVTF